MCHRMKDDWFNNRCIERTFQSNNKIFMKAVQKEDSSRNILGCLEMFIKLADELQ